MSSAGNGSLSRARGVSLVAGSGKSGRWLAVGLFGDSNRFVLDFGKYLGQ